MCLCMKASIVKVAAFVSAWKEASKAEWLIFPCYINWDRSGEMEGLKKQKEKTEIVLVVAC